MVAAAPPIQVRPRSPPMLAGPHQLPRGEPETLGGSASFTPGRARVRVVVEPSAEWWPATLPSLLPVVHDGKAVHLVPDRSSSSNCHVLYVCFVRTCLLDPPSSSHTLDLFALMAPAAISRSYWLLSSPRRGRRSGYPAARSCPHGRRTRKLVRPSPRREAPRSRPE